MAQDDALSSAKKTLAKANAFEKSSDPTGALKPKAAPTPKPPAAPPVTPSMHSGSVSDESHQAAAAEAAKIGMKGIPILHSGGVMKETGPAMLKKGETVRTPEQEKAMAEEKPKKEKKASPEALMTSEDKGPKKEAKSEKKGKGGGFTHTHIDHFSHGGHGVRHHHKDGSDKDVAYSAQDLEGVKQGLQEHIGGGAGQVMNAAAEPPAAPEPVAAAAPPAAAMPQQV